MIGNSHFTTKCHMSWTRVGSATGGRGGMLCTRGGRRYYVASLEAQFLLQLLQHKISCHYVTGEQGTKLQYCSGCSVYLGYCVRGSAHRRHWCGSTPEESGNSTSDKTTGAIPPSLAPDSVSRTLSPPHLCLYDSSCYWHLINLWNLLHPHLPTDSVWR